MISITSILPGTTFFLLTIAIITNCAARDQTGPIGLDALLHLDRLPELRSDVKVGMVSSYDRSGGNDDGFSGKDSFVRKENGALVLAELTGPGVIYRLWTPTPTNDVLEFYFDGEREPRIRRGFRELFTEGAYPFVRPLADYGAGGFFSYLPIPFKKSCKVLIRTDRMHFYQINYTRYPSGAGIESYTGYDSTAESDMLAQVRDLFAAPGSDITQHVAPPAAELLKTRTTARVEPGATVTLFETASGGRIVGLRLGPADALSDKLRRLVLRIYWDNEAEPAVISPVGDLFGFAWGNPAVRSLFTGTENNKNYLYLPMPFDHSARIELESEGDSHAPVEIQAEVIYTDIARKQSEGKLYALWRRENPTAIGVPFTFVDTKGRGHVVGTILQAQGLESGSTRFFEGDDQATIDGKLVIHGTGSEDFFNGGWYDVPGRWYEQTSFALSGSLGYWKSLSRTGGYRFFLGDSYSYDKTMLLTIEHAPVDNSFATDYTAVTFLYSEQRPSMTFTLPGPQKRGVVDFDRLVFAPGRNVMIDSFSTQNMTLTKMPAQIDGERTSYLSIQAHETDMFGPHNIAFRLTLEQDGRYRVLIEALAGPGQGIVQIFERERPLGDARDLYAPVQSKSAPLPLAELDMQAGQNVIMFKLVGTNTLSAGLGLDLINIILEKID